MNATQSKATVTRNVRIATGRRLNDFWGLNAIYEGGAIIILLGDQPRIAFRPYLDYWTAKQDGLIVAHQLLASDHDDIPTIAAVIAVTVAKVKKVRAAL